MKILILFLSLSSAGLIIAPQFGPFVERMSLILTLLVAFLLLIFALDRIRFILDCIMSIIYNEGEGLTVQHRIIGLPLDIQLDPLAKDTGTVPADSDRK